MFLKWMIIGYVQVPGVRSNNTFSIRLFPGIRPSTKAGYPTLIKHLKVIVETNWGSLFPELLQFLYVISKQTAINHLKIDERFCKPECRYSHMLFKPQINPLRPGSLSESYAAVEKSPQQSLFKMLSTTKRRPYKASPLCPKLLVTLNWNEVKSWNKVTIWPKIETGLKLIDQISKY